MSSLTQNDVSRVLSQAANRRLEPAASRRAIDQAQQFESVFVAQMLNQMRGDAMKGTGFEGGHAEDRWRGLMNEQMAKDISAAGGVGVSAQVARELLRGQESRVDAIGAAPRRIPAGSAIEGSRR